MRLRQSQTTCAVLACAVCVLVGVCVYSAWGVGAQGGSTGGWVVHAESATTPLRALASELVDRVGGERWAVRVSELDTHVPGGRELVDRLARSAVLTDGLAPYTGRGKGTQTVRIEPMDVVASAPDLLPSYHAHVDSPLSWVPFVTVVRCLVVLDASGGLETVFPLRSADNDGAVRLLPGHVLCFDMARDPHLTRVDPITPAVTQGSGLRIVLKIHTAVAPWWVPRHAVDAIAALAAAYAAHLRGAAWNSLPLHGADFETYIGTPNAVLGLGLVVLARVFTPKPGAVYDTAVAAASVVPLVCELVALVFGSVDPAVAARDVAFWRVAAALVTAWALARAVAQAGLASPPAGAAVVWAACLGAALLTSYAHAASLAACLFVVVPELRARFGGAAIVHVLLGLLLTWVSVAGAEPHTKLDGTFAYTQLRDGYLPFHRAPLNVAVHTVTVSVCIAALIGAVGSSWPSGAGVFVTGYATVLRYTVDPVSPFAATTAMLCAALAFAALFLSPARPYLSAWPCIGIAIMAGVVQEFAHRATFEPTFMDAYFDSDDLWTIALKLPLHALWESAFVAEAAASLAAS